jgi:dUTP pyrophosphatase
MEIKIKRVGAGKLPEYKTEGSAGADCYARLEKEITIKAGKSETIPLGFAVEIPTGYEMQIRGRSGLARKNSIDCFQGTIDSDYRGEVCAILLNKGQEDFTVKPSDRIAQAVIAPVITARWNEIENLSETERGDGGFGHTGVSEEKNKFYEPFKTVEEAEKFLNKSVIIDGKDEGVITAIKTESKYGVNCLAVEVTMKKDCAKEFFSSTLAFSRIKVDGHCFGKEIEFEND